MHLHAYFYCWLNHSCPRFYAKLQANESESLDRRLREQRAGSWIITVHAFQCGFKPRRHDEAKERYVLQLSLLDPTGIGTSISPTHDMH